MDYYYFLSPCTTSQFCGIDLRLTDETLKINYLFHLSLRIGSEEWDIEKQRPKNIYLKKYKLLNAKLDRIKILITESIKERIKKKKILTQKILASQIKKYCYQKETEHQENNLLFYVKEYIGKKNGLICHSTMKRYKVFLRLLERFEGYTTQRILIENVNSEFVKDFLQFGKKEEYCESTLHRTVYFVRTILNFAARKGIRTYTEELVVKKFAPQGTIMTLSEQELNKIEEMEVPKELQDAKGWLIISCYTGQRISDFMNFSREQLQFIDGKLCLSFFQKKTKKHILLPLHPNIRKVMEQYQDNFPKYLSPHLYNSQIKEIAKLSGLNEVLRTRKRRGFRSQIENAEKWEVLTSHIGRRSFATNFYGKIPTPLLMRATGHATEQMFLNYINYQQQVISLSEHFERLAG
jgi:site-specific recombinase XerD